MGRLVEAVNLCWGPHVPDEPPLTLTAFKRDVRDLHVWCSSSMIALEGNDPIGVLIGAKRSTETLIHRIAVRPDRVRRGHGRHLLESLGAKLAILGPPRIVTEIPETWPAAAGFFEARGFALETTLTDLALDAPPDGRGGTADATVGAGLATPVAPAGSALIPTSVADLEANGLLIDPPGVPWERAATTLHARNDLLAGIALATEDAIRGYVLYQHDPGRPGAALAGLRAPDAAAAAVLLRSVASRTGLPLLLPKSAPGEIPSAWLDGLGFRAAGRSWRYATSARPG